MLSTLTIDTRIAELAAMQHGVVTVRQLHSIGLDGSAIARRVRGGMMTRVLPGTYVLGRDVTRPSATWLMAGVLSSPHPSALARTSAARALGLWDRDDATVHVVSRRRVRRMATGFQFHVCHDLSDDDIADVSGIPTTGVSRTIIDLGHVLTSHQIASVLHEAAFRRVLDLDDIHRRVVRKRHAPGIGTVAHGIALHDSGSAGTRSRTEDQLLAALMRARCPVPLVNVRNATSIRGVECDFVWPDARLVVEVDGAGHARPGARASDRRRDEVLERAGWRVLRFEAAQVWRATPSAVASIVRALREC